VSQRPATLWKNARDAGSVDHQVYWGQVYLGSLAAGPPRRKHVAANAVLSRAKPFDHPLKALLRRSRRTFARTDDTLRLLTSTQHWPECVFLVSGLGTAATSLSNDPESSSPHQFCPVCTIGVPGYDLRERQV
jgi:hypothetical protein